MTNPTNSPADLVSWSGPVPEPDPHGQVFWRGLAEGRLVLLRCRTCRTWIHYPREACHTCGSSDLTEQEIDSRGVVYSYSVVHREFVPGVSPPYVLALVDLVDAAGVRVVTNVVDCAPDAVYIGMPVRPVFRRLSPDVGLLFVEPEAGMDRG